MNGSSARECDGLPGPPGRDSEGLASLPEREREWLVECERLAVCVPDRGLADCLLECEGLDCASRVDAQFSLNPSIPPHSSLCFSSQIMSSNSSSLPSQTGSSSFSSSRSTSSVESLTHFTVCLSMLS